MGQNTVFPENTPVPTQKNKTKLVDILIIDENTALNVIVDFLSLGLKRCAFTFDESAKIWECIKMFQK
jgi:hypothetical protein